MVKNEVIVVSISAFLIFALGFSYAAVNEDLFPFLKENRFFSFCVLCITLGASPLIAGYMTKNLLGNKGIWNQKANWIGFGFVSALVVAAFGFSFVLSIQAETLKIDVSKVKETIALGYASEMWLNLAVALSVLPMALIWKKWVTQIKHQGWSSLAR